MNSYVFVIEMRYGFVQCELHFKYCLHEFRCSIGVMARDHFLPAVSPHSWVRKLN